MGLPQADKSTALKLNDLPRKKSQKRLRFYKVAEMVAAHIKQKPKEAIIPGHTLFTDYKWFRKQVKKDHLLKRDPSEQAWALSDTQEEKYQRLIKKSKKSPEEAKSQKKLERKRRRAKLIRLKLDVYLRKTSKIHRDFFKVAKEIAAYLKLNSKEKIKKGHRLYKKMKWLRKEYRRLKKASTQNSRFNKRERDQKMAWLASLELDIYFNKTSRTHNRKIKEVKKKIEAFNEKNPNKKIRSGHPLYHDLTWYNKSIKNN